MYIDTVIRSIMARIPNTKSLAVCDIVGLGLKFHEHDIYFLACPQDDACCGDLGFDCQLPVGKALVEAFLDPWVMLVKV